MTLYQLLPFVWVENKTGEHIAFTVLGWYIIMQLKNGQYYWSHNGIPHFGFKTIEDAKYDAERDFRLKMLENTLQAVTE